MEITPPPGNDWPDYCAEHKAWCLSVIHDVLKFNGLRMEVFGNMRTPKVPEAKTAELRLKCHQNPKCVKKAQEKMRNDLMKVSSGDGSWLDRLGGAFTKYVRRKWDF